MIKDSGRSRCAMPGCNFQVTPEQLCCRGHWDLVPGVLKEEWQKARIADSPEECRRIRIEVIREIRYQLSKEKK